MSVVGGALAIVVGRCVKSVVFRAIGRWHFSKNANVNKKRKALKPLAACSAHTLCHFSFFVFKSR
ncbi:hypothetical protein CPT_MTx_103 [Serratia phage MTx]|uniref:Uncharacterized protein n=1 Tax=Serratia phage MTx TaxID=2557553 RepID=A0A482MGS8_9CAUD|nr:hypothetical protein HWC15_gp103 [Serratia phage MTx]QBQ72409.1 hypothetical protein CPT_MTx_103 [Serratia phage MTx]